MLKYQAVIRRENLLLALKCMFQRHVSYIRMLPPYLMQKKFKNSVDMTCRLGYYIYVAYDGNELNTVCGSGGTADALASGASGGDPVEVQILSTAPFKSQV